MTNYRIIRKNSKIDWVYKIQYKYFGIFWFNIPKQAYNEFDLEMTQATLRDLINAEKDYIKRKKIGNGVL